MFVEATPGIGPGFGFLDQIPDARIEQAGEDIAHKSVLILGIGGANALHFRGATRDLENEGYEIHGTDVRDSLDPVGQLHRVDTPEGQDSLRQLIERGGIGTVYISLTEDMHVDSICEYLGYVGAGKIDRVVVPKPAVLSPSEASRVDRARKTAEEQVRVLRELPPDAEIDILDVHEHYIKKGAWDALRKRLGEVADRLGRLTMVAIDIQEDKERTPEKEGRVRALRNGLYADLMPHILSLGFDLQDAIREGDRYEIPNCLQAGLRRVRYNSSMLPEQRDTGFVVEGTARIRDTVRDTEHDVKVVARAGKGLVNKKGVRLGFMNDQTGELTTIGVDLQSNTLDVEPVGDLFPQTQFTDNGYGDVMRRGLSGDKPEDCFQPWRTAVGVTLLQYKIAHANRRGPEMHPLGTSLEELGDLALSGV